MAALFRWYESSGGIMMNPPLWRRFLEHAPLTQQHIDFLNNAENGPIELSTIDKMDQGLELEFLADAGYLLCEQTYVDPVPANNRYRWTRTDKPIP